MNRVRVAVIDDDDITRTGVTSLLAAEPSIEVVLADDHAGGIAHDDWSSIDVALVDASDHRQPLDQFPGVGVVEVIRRCRTSEQTRIIVVTGVLFDDAVRRRMREAGADFYFHRSDLVTAEALLDAVLRPDDGDRVPPAADHEELHRLGVVDRSRINDGLAAARVEGFVERDPALAQRGRDRWRRRRRFNDAAMLEARNRDGSSPERQQEVPSLSQIERVLQWATRIRDRDHR